MTKMILPIFAFLLPVATLAEYKVEEVKMEKQIAVSRKMEGNPEHAGKLIHEALVEVENYLKEKKIQAAGRPYVRTFEIKSGVWKFEAGIPVAKKPKLPKGKLVATELPSGRAIKTVHTGLYSEKKGAFKALQEYMLASKLMQSGPQFEIYANDPKDTKKEDLKTEIYFPVK